MARGPASASGARTDARHEQLLALCPGSVWSLALDPAPGVDAPPAELAASVLTSARISDCNLAFAARFTTAEGSPVAGVAPGDLAGFWLVEDPHRLEELAAAGFQSRALSVTELTAGGRMRNLTVDMSPIVEQGRITGLLAIELETPAQEPGEGAHEGSPVPDPAEAGLADRTEQERHEALAHVSRLSTLGEMASGIAHEFNQPLAAIVNYANGCMRLLEQRGVDDQMVFRALGSIVDQGQRASEIIRRLRSFARRGDDDREPLRMADILEESIELIAQPLKRARVEVETDFVGTGDVVVVDGIQIQQVVMNLLLNAIEALGEKSPPTERRIRVSTQIAGDPGSSSGVRDPLTGGSTQAYVETIVADNGPGVSDEVSQRLFDPFYSASGKGLGLGLPTGRSIVEAHGGRLWLGVTPDTSSRTSGARFHFTLPLGRGPIRS